MSSVTSPLPEKTIKETLYDEDSKIHDPIFTIENMYDIHFLHSNIATLGDYLNLFQPNLVKVVVPQTYNYLKLIQWCFDHYNEGKRVVLSKNRVKIVCAISPQSIATTRLLPKQPYLQTLSKEFLTEKY